MISFRSRNNVVTPLLELVVQLRAVLEADAESGFRCEVLTCVPMNALVDEPTEAWQSNLDGDILWASYVPLLIVRVIHEPNRTPRKSRDLPRDELVPELALLDCERSETRAVQKELVRIGVPTGSVNLQEPNWLHVWQAVAISRNEANKAGRPLTKGGQKALSTLFRGKNKLYQLFNLVVQEEVAAQAVLEARPYAQAEVGGRACHDYTPRRVTALEREDQELLDYLQTSRYDFVVFRKSGTSGWRPVLAVEFDGGSHQAPERVKADKKKNKIAEASDLPLFRIGDDSVNSHPERRALYQSLLWRVVRAARRREANEKHYELQWKYKEPVLCDYYELLDEVQLKHPDVDLSESGAIAKLERVVSRRLDQLEDKLFDLEMWDWEEPDDFDLAFHHAFGCYPHVEYVGDAETGMRAFL